MVSPWRLAGARLPRGAIFGCLRAQLVLALRAAGQARRARKPPLRGVKEVSGGLSSRPWIDLAVLLSLWFCLCAIGNCSLEVRTTRYLLRDSVRSEAHLASKQLQALELCDVRVSSSAEPAVCSTLQCAEHRAYLVRNVSLVRSAATPLRSKEMGQGRRRHTGAPPKRGKAKKGQQPTQQKPRATGSLAVAAAAARLQQQRAADAQASSEGRAPKELDVLERCYASWRRDPDILVVATCRDAQSAKSLRMACKALGAPALALHAALSSQAAKEAASLRKGGVLAVTNDARDRLKQCLQRAKAQKARFDNLAPPSGFEALPWPSELWTDLDDVKKRCALARKASSSIKDKKRADVARLAGSADATSKKKTAVAGHDRR